MTPESINKTQIEALNTIAEKVNRLVDKREEEARNQTSPQENHSVD